MAIDDLLSAGFDRMDLSLLASAAAVEEKLGHRFMKVETIADDQSLPRAAYVSPEAIGDAEGGIIGALMYIGAMTAGELSSPPGYAGGTRNSRRRCRRQRWFDWGNRGEMDWLASCTLPTRSTGARRIAFVG